jgi:hypothetical protein
VNGTAAEGAFDTYAGPAQVVTVAELAAAAGRLDVLASRFKLAH